MKRIRAKEEFESIQRSTRERNSTSSTDDLIECSFYDFLYEQPGNGVKESDVFIANKLCEIEHEIDKLPDGKSKEAYFIALKQEIKQQVLYVRSKEFLLSFLRTEAFDAPKAALRLVEFLKNKLELFGEEKLPRRIKQDDLTEDDKRALLSGYYHLDLDCKGRLVILFQMDLLLAAGLLHERYINNILRANMYQIMYGIEKNDKHKNEMVVIRWSLDPTSTVSMKNHRLFFFAAARLLLFALPIRCVATHHCLGNDLFRMCGLLAESFLRKYTKHLFKMHGPSAAACFAEISKYGIDVKSFPLTSTGHFNEAIHLQNVDRMRQNEKENDFLSINNTIQIEQRNTGVVVAPECRSFMDTKSPATSKFHEGRKPNEINYPDSKVEKSTGGKLLAKSFNIAKEDALRKFELLNSRTEVLQHKLMELLETNQYPDTLWWSKDGTSFVFHKEKLCQNVLLKEFNGIKFNSFLRNIRRWGFQRILNTGRGQSPIMLEYRHDLFQRNSPHLLSEWDCNNIEKKKSEKQYKFPITLMKALNSNEESGAIWWECDETAIAFDNEKIENVLLDKHFRGLKIKSFNRTLRRWGFKRLFNEEIKHSNNVMIFHHALFRKNLLLSPDLLEKWMYLDGSEQAATRKKRAGFGEAL